jgi:hypothetical protein
MRYYYVYNQYGTMIWSGRVGSEQEAWECVRLATETPEDVPLEELTGGPYGLQMISWPKMVT